MNDEVQTGPEDAQADEQTPAAQSLEGSIVAERYRVDKLLGEGGMGAVYRAEHIHMRKTVALKVLHAEMTDVEEVVARFEREAVAAGRIEHPNVATATDFGRLDDGSFFLVLEYAAGRDLRQLLSAVGAVTPERCIHIARQVAAGLGAAHALTIVHRDLKPDNVMLIERDGDPDFVKVLDFGIAKVTLGDQKDQPALTRMGAVFGTPDYMSPEQALGQSVDHRSDLYALGVLMYEMLTGATPFESDDAMVTLANQITAPPPPLPESVPAGLSALIMSLLSKDVQQRPQSAAEVVQALDVLEGPVSVAAPISPPAMIRNSAESLPNAGYVPTTLAIPSSGRGAIELSNGPATALGRGPAIVPAATAPQIPATKPLDALVRDARLAMQKIAPSLTKPIKVGATTLPAWAPLTAVAGLSAFLLLLVVILSLVLVSATDTPSVASASSGVIPVLSWQPARSDSAPTLVSSAEVERIEAMPVYKRSLEDWVALSRGYAQMKRYRECALAYRSVLQLERSRRNDPQLLADLRVAAQDPDAYSLVVNLAEGRAGLGETGVDLLWDIWNDLRVKDDVQAEATFKKLVILSRRASKSLRVAIDLNATDRCEKLEEVVDRGTKYADRRSLARLEHIAGKTGCSQEGCFACLAGSEKLGKAIERAKTRKTPSIEQGYR